jgi:aquaporin NIP
VTRSLVQRCLAEVAGTALLVGIGTGAIVAGANAGGVPQWVLAIAWFVAVAVPVFAFAFVSGSHINPVVTLALAVSERFPPREAPAYVGSQFVGAFVGSGVVLAALGSRARLGATLPKDGNVALAFVLEFGFTAALIASVFWLTRPGPTPSKLELFLPAIVVGISTYFIGPWTGSSLNPARTVAPAALSGDTSGIWVYLTAVPLAALCLACVVRWRSGDRARSVAGSEDRR